MTEQDKEIPGASRRQRAIEAYAGARDRTVGTLSEAPLIALAGGLAAGALIAALLPRSEAETRAGGALTSGPSKTVRCTSGSGVSTTEASA